jgi:hypothetical protein
MNKLILTLVAIGGMSSIAHAQAPVTAEQCVNRDDGSSICINDRVLDYRNLEGTLQAIYSDYTGVVAYDSGETDTIDLQYVSREVSCIYGFCAGDAVFDSDNAEGRITDVYENGMAEISYSDGEVWYLAVNTLTPVADDNIEVVYRWAPPRPYPDLNVYHCFFGPPPAYNPYGWPEGYPYPRPIFGVNRVLFGIFPIAPPRCGFHNFNPYPYPHPVQWNSGYGMRSPDGNRHGGFAPGAPGGGFNFGQHPGGPGNFSGNNGPHPMPVGPGNDGPRPGNGGPGNFPGNNGPHPAPIGGGGNPGPIGGGGNPHPQPFQPMPINHPAPSPVPGPYRPAPSPGGNSGGGFGGGGQPAPRPAPAPAPRPAPGGFGGGGGGGQPSRPAPSPGGGGGGGRPGGGGHR